LTELAVLRYTVSGVPDTPFGTGGGAFAPPASSGSLSDAASIAVQTNGDIVAGGLTTVVGSGIAQFEMARFTGAGKIVAVGNSSKVVSGSTNASRFALARYLAQ